jgi:hypothetical protein
VVAFFDGAGNGDHHGLLTLAGDRPRLGRKDLLQCHEGSGGERGHRASVSAAFWTSSLKQHDRGADTTRVTSALDEGVVVEDRAPVSSASVRRDVLADLDGFVTRIRVARRRLHELAAMLDSPPADTALVDGVQRAATRLRDGVLEEARRAAEVLVDDAAANHNGSLTVHATDDVVIGVHPDEDTARRHREVLELQRGVEELSFVITPLVEEQPPAGVDPMPVSSPPDSWTAADAFAEVFR